MEDKTLDNYVQPFIENKFKDADVILMAGSQGRQANGTADQANKPRKNSDYDFVIIYPQLPKRFPAALFASAWLDTGKDERVSIDMKIVDHNYLPFHTEHTQHIRRFPFLFGMIKEGYALQDRNGKFPTLRDEAERVFTDGPAKLGPTQIAETRQKVTAFSKSMQSAKSLDDCQVHALEGIQVLAQSQLISLNLWNSPIDRNITALSRHTPGQGDRLMAAFQQANLGDTRAYTPIATEINTNLDARLTEGGVDHPLLRQVVVGPVHTSEKSISDQNGAKIMVGQYLARLGDKDGLDTARQAEIESILWTTLKKTLCEQTGTAFNFGKATADIADKAFGKPVLRQLFNAIKAEDEPGMEAAAHDVLGSQGGLRFNYLERIYVEDLARRRTTVANRNPENGSFFRYG